MSTTIGPRVALWGRASLLLNRGWNRFREEEVFFETSSKEIFSLDVYAEKFRMKLYDVQEDAWIYVAQVLREDAEILLGFESFEERRIFLELLNLDSVGPRMAAQSLAFIGVERLLQLLLGQITSKGLKVPGLGPKSIDKIVAGMQGRREVFLSLLQQDSRLSISVGRSSAASKTFLPPLLFQSLEKLGLRPVDIERLYSEQSQLDPTFGDAELANQMKVLLQKWGQSRNPSLRREEKLI